MGGLRTGSLPVFHMPITVFIYKKLSSSPNIFTISDHREIFFTPPRDHRVVALNHLRAAALQSPRTAFQSGGNDANQHTGNKHTPRVTNSIMILNSQP